MGDGVMSNPYGSRVLITGGSSGLGRACALTFAKDGCTVYALSRKCEERQELLGSGKIVSVRADVTDMESIRRAYEQTGPVDIIIHSAGFGIAGAAEDTPLKLVQRQMDTNYYGVLRVNQVYMPDMRRQRRGLILIISSVAGRVPIPFQSHYSSCKYALEAYAECLRMECAQYGIRASLIEPGDTHTGFTGARKFSDANSPYYEQCKKAVAQMEHDELNGRPPESVSDVALRIAAKKNPPVRTAVGFEYKALLFLQRLLPWNTAERILKMIYLK